MASHTLPANGMDDNGARDSLLYFIIRICKKKFAGTCTVEYRDATFGEERATDGNVRKTRVMRSFSSINDCESMNERLFIQRSTVAHRDYMYRLF